MFNPPDQYVWDFWTVQDQGVTHLFYLSAPRSLPDPEMRHANARCGHAVSRDLVHWTQLPIALEPGAAGSWDDRAIWTGSVCRAGDRWAMLYTGTNWAEDGKIQRVGLAWSDDLISWNKDPANPVIEADPSRYLGQNQAHHQELAWRDPFLMPDPAGDGYLAYMTAQRRETGPGKPGCIALARSSDLRSWTVGEPVTEMDEFFLMEIPQVIPWKGRYILVFNADRSWVREGCDVPVATGAFYAVSDRCDGGSRYAGPLAIGATNALFGIKLLPAPDGSPTAIGWRGYQPDGSFLGGITDPLPTRIGPDARIDCLTP